MSEFLKANGEDAPYFVTLTVAGWIDVLTRSAYSYKIVQNLMYCQQHKGLKVYAYVIMSSHLHLIVRRQYTHGLLSDLLRDFKSYTAKQLLKAISENDEESRKGWMMHLFRYYAKYEKQNKENMFWQKTSHPVELYSNRMTLQKVDYIHYNPVKAGLVTELQHYLTLPVQQCLCRVALEGAVVLGSESGCSVVRFRLALPSGHYAKGLRPVAGFSVRLATGRRPFR